MRAALNEHGSVAAMQRDDATSRADQIRVPNTATLSGDPNKSGRPPAQDGAASGITSRAYQPNAPGSHFRRHPILRSAPAARWAVLIVFLVAELLVGALQLALVLWAGRSPLIALESTILFLTLGAILLVFALGSIERVSGNGARGRTAPRK